MTELPLFENISRRGRHQSTIRGFVLTLEFIAHLRHRHPLDALVLVNVVNDPNKVHCHLTGRFLEAEIDLPFLHEERMRAPRDVGVDGHGEYKLVVFAVEIIEMILNTNQRPPRAANTEKRANGPSRAPLHPEG
jgi:hypothetical protein